MYRIVKEDKIGLYVNAYGEEKNYLTFLYWNPSLVKKGSIVNGFLDQYHFFTVEDLVNEEKMRGENCTWTPKSKIVRMKRFVLNAIKTIA